MGYLGTTPPFYGEKKIKKGTYLNFHVRSIERQGTIILLWAETTTDNWAVEGLVGQWHISHICIKEYSHQKGLPCK